MVDIVKLFKAGRGAAVPLFAVSTPDPAATVQKLSQSASDEVPKVQWDIVRGFAGVNEAGRDVINDLGDQAEGAVGDPVEALVLCHKLPGKTILFFYFGNRFFESVQVVQATWNLRDAFKTDRRALVILGPSFSVPAELTNDILVLDEPLPTPDQLGAIVDEMSVAAEVPVDDSVRALAVEAVQGLAAFPAEQAIAMSFTPDGLGVADLWERKRQQIEQEPSLKVWNQGEKFSDIGGCDNVKGFLKRLAAGPGRPNAIVFVDEIEKALAGEGDTSGVSQDQLGCLLSYMQDNDSDGMIFIGPPGAAKSAMAKATGNEAGIPTIQLDLGAAKGSLVGQSEQQIRAALKVITSVSNGKAMWIATCNRIATLPAELRRRFTMGTFFFDLPTAEERTMIWPIYIAKYGLPVSEGVKLPRDTDWTGAEIKNCCKVASVLACPLIEAAKYITPVAKTAPESIARLREQCDGRFLSASYSGFYRTEGPVREGVALPAGRAAIQMGESATV